MQKNIAFVNNLSCFYAHWIWTSYVRHHNWWFTVLSSTAANFFRMATQSNDKPTMDKYTLKLCSIIPRRFKLQTLFTITVRRIRIRPDPRPFSVQLCSSETREVLVYPLLSLPLEPFQAHNRVRLPLLSRCWRFGFLHFQTKRNFLFKEIGA